MPEYNNLALKFDGLDFEIYRRTDDLSLAMNNVDPNKWEQVYPHIDTIVILGERIAEYYTGVNSLWFHAVLRPDGAPYRREEAELIRRLTREVG